MRVAVLALPAEPSSATHARRLARETAAPYGPEVADVVALVATELVTNAVLHAGTELVFRVDVEPPVVRLSVSDGSPRPPRVRSFLHDDATGRGLAIVEALASEWGVHRDGDGKTVWCTVAIPDGVGKAPR